VLFTELSLDLFEQLLGRPRYGELVIPEVNQREAAKT
jgi:hypothetical protein